MNAATQRTVGSQRLRTVAKWMLILMVTFLLQQVFAPVSHWIGPDGGDSGRVLNSSAQVLG
jgi:hypothetical protein